MNTTLLDSKDKIKWSNKSGKYSINGKVANDRRVYKFAQHEIQRYEDKMVKLTTRFVNGNLTFEQWQETMAKLIRESHVSLTRIGRGGKENTFANHYLQVGTDLRLTHYTAFRQFSQDILNGKLSDRQIIARAKLYGTASKNSFEKARLTLYDDNYQARRRLGTCANHCTPCLSYASQGWMNLTAIIPPGQQCDCRMNCCCSVEIKRTLT